LKAAGREISIEDIKSRWESTLHSIEERKEKLASSLDTQKEHDALCKQFAEASGHSNQFLQEQNKAVSSVSGDPEAQVKALGELSLKLEAGRSDLDKVIDLSNKLDAAFITTNPYTELNAKTLGNQFRSILDSTKKREKEIQKDILAKSGSKVSAEQIAEFKEVFQYFDKNKNGKLSKLEFKGVLQSIGEDPTDGEIDTLHASLDKDHDGFITFEEFTEFMVSRTADTDTSEQLLQSFKEIANDKEFITEDDLKRAMEPAKVEFLVQHMPKHAAGGYDYKTWVTHQFK